jgi:hypothetical protein
MALIYQATVVPSKLDMLAAWLPGRPWFAGRWAVTSLGSYRFDDPAGEVGVEALFVRAGDGSAYHVPLTYRSSPLGSDEFLVGVTQHSVLGTRWVYDGCGDPVAVLTATTAILTGASQADEFIKNADGLEQRATAATVRGSGSPGTLVPDIGPLRCLDDGLTTVVATGSFELVVVRVVGSPIQAEQTLTGGWADSAPTVLAGVRPA